MGRVPATLHRLDCAGVLTRILAHLDDCGYTGTPSPRLLENSIRGHTSLPEAMHTGFVILAYPGALDRFRPPGACAWIVQCLIGFSIRRASQDPL